MGKQFTNMTIFAAALGVILLGYFFAVSFGEKFDNQAKQRVEGEQTKIMITLKTNFGKIKLELFTKDAPKTVENFVKLAKSGFYNGTKFHRVIKDFMLQGGDPNSKDDDWSNDGSGGPGYKFEDEINPWSLGVDENTIKMSQARGYVYTKDLTSHKMVRGVLAMANSGPNTNGSQFFIVTKEATPWLDGMHTAFGKVVEGMDVVDRIENLPKNQNDHPTQDAVVESVEVAE